MSNEEINVLINLHIEELENDVKPTEVQKKRIIKALKQITEKLTEENCQYYLK